MLLYAREFAVRSDMSIHGERAVRRHFPQPFMARASLAVAMGLMLAILGGCATLPASGPTAREIRRGAGPGRSSLAFQIKNIEPGMLEGLNAGAAAADHALPTLANLRAPGRNDAIGSGDILAISVYEVGVSMFGARSGGQDYDPSAHAETFPAVVVDHDGAITLPYVGRLVVAGHTPVEVQRMVAEGLRGKSQSPQVIVAVRQNVSNTIFVGGDVRRPGRFELTLQGERLLDAIALGGGAAYSSEDTVVRFNRGGQTLEERLGRIRAGAADDLTLLPGDRIELIKRPRTFVVLGATGKISQTAFETGDLSLGEAIARAGGPSDAQADPSAIFLFRYEAVAGRPGMDVPVVYRLDMMKPESYFLAQRFGIRDKDVLYIANAAANRPAKLVAIINQLFSPFVAARAVSGK